MNLGYNDPLCLLPIVKHVPKRGLLVDAVAIAFQMTEAGVAA